MSYEIEVIPGIEEFAEAEIRKRAPGATVFGRPREGRIAVGDPDQPRRLNDLQSVVAVYQVERFDVPRPKALLGHQNFQKIVTLIQGVIARYPRGSFRTFHLSAAGAESATLRRFAELIARETGLPATSGPGNLLVIVRRPPAGSAGWEVLVRTSPRPLSARSWRVCDLPGALNASVAHVMAALTGPSPDQRFLNLACGSGTLLIERLAMGPARWAIGVDDDPRALTCARENVQASGDAGAITLLRADATHVPLPDACADAIVADLPYGMLVGSQRENARLYPAILHEAARVAAPGASFVAITASRKLFESAMADSAVAWRLARAIPLKIPFQSGSLRPKIYVLRQTP